MDRLGDTETVMVEKVEPKEEGTGEATESKEEKPAKEAVEPQKDETTTASDDNASHVKESNESTETGLQNDAKEKKAPKITTKYTIMPAVTYPPAPPIKEVPAVLPVLPRPPRLKAMAARPTPLRVNTTPMRRPATSGTRRLSLSSVSSRRPIKYGTGRHSRVELVPQPSDNDEDPLNWPAWKKELHFAALLLPTALAGVSKTALVPIHGQLAAGYAVSYTAAAALTGVPLLVSAVAGLASLMAARIWGRRPVYLTAAMLLFAGSLGTVSAGQAGRFRQCMAARVFQGLGWGAFDTLVLGSIHDTFFSHERPLRSAVHNLVVVGSTWGAPLVGGAVSGSAAGGSSGGFGLFRPFAVLSSCLGGALLLLALGSPETAFDRSFYVLATPASAWSDKQLPLRPRRTLSLAAARDYLRTMKPYAHRAAPPICLGLLLQAPRAMVAPTTALLALVSLLPFCALWGLASSLSLLFAPLPFMLSSASIGLLLTAPWLMASAVVALAAVWSARSEQWQRRLGMRWTGLQLGHAATVCAGSLLSLAGLLAFGLYVPSCLGHDAADPSAFTVGGAGAARLSFPGASMLLGLLAAGAYLLDATVRPLVRRSAQFTSPSIAAQQRVTADMCAGVALWRALGTGAFVLALPNAVWSAGPLRASSIGIAVTQVAVGAAVAAVWWRFGETIRRWDGQVMKCVDLALLRGTGSFFDTD